MGSILEHFRKRYVKLAYQNTKLASINDPIMVDHKYGLGYVDETEELPYVPSKRKWYCARTTSPDQDRRVLVLLTLVNRRNLKPNPTLETIAFYKKDNGTSHQYLVLESLEEFISKYDDGYGKLSITAWSYI